MASERSTDIAGDIASTVHLPDSEQCVSEPNVYFLGEDQGSDPLGLQQRPADSFSDDQDIPVDQGENAGVDAKTLNLPVLVDEHATTTHGTSLGMEQTSAHENTKAVKQEDGSVKEDFITFHIPERAEQDAVAKMSLKDSTSAAFPGVKEQKDPVSERNLTELPGENLPAGILEQWQKVQGSDFLQWQKVQGSDFLQRVDDKPIVDISDLCDKQHPEAGKKAMCQIFQSIKATVAGSFIRTLDDLECLQTAARDLNVDLWMESDMLYFVLEDLSLLSNLHKRLLHSKGESLSQRCLHNIPVETVDSGQTRCHQETQYEVITPEMEKTMAVITPQTKGDQLKYGPADNMDKPEKLVMSSETTGEQLCEAVEKPLTTRGRGRKARYKYRKNLPAKRKRSSLTLSEKRSRQESASGECTQDDSEEPLAAEISSKGDDQPVLIGEAITAADGLDEGDLKVIREINVEIVSMDNMPPLSLPAHISSSSITQIVADEKPSSEATSAATMASQAEASTPEKQERKGSDEDVQDVKRTLKGKALKKGGSPSQIASLLGRKPRKRDYETLAPYKFFCNMCSFKSKRESHYQKHISLHVQKNLPIYKCSHCSFSTLRLSHLKKHEISHSVQVIRCKHEGCSYSTDTEKHMTTHVRLKHMPVLSGKGKNGVAIDPGAAVPQTREDIMIYECDFCDYKTDKMFRFRRHHICHTQVPGNTGRILKGLVLTYQCSSCPYKSKRKEHFIRHMENVHSDRRPYLCDLCGAGFKRQDTLKTHRFVHLSRNDRFYPYSCHLCGKCFRTKAHLRDHASKHSAKREYLCELCGASFKTRGVQRKHIQTIHRNPGAFECDKCARRFNTRFALHRHVKTHELGAEGIDHVDTSELGESSQTSLALSKMDSSVEQSTTATATEATPIFMSSTTTDDPLSAIQLHPIQLQTVQYSGGLGPVLGSVPVQAVGSLEESELVNETEEKSTAAGVGGVQALALSKLEHTLVQTGDGNFLYVTNITPQLS